MELKGRGVVITGASRGLGAGLMFALAREGARVVGVARQSEALDAVVKQVRHAGGEAHALVADMGDKNAIHPLAGAAAALVGPIDVLIHNASTLGPTPLPLLLDTACEDLEQVLAVNLVGPFRLTKALVGSMALRGDGLVVHLSSDAAVSAYPRWGSYGVSKAALDHLARTWAAELESMGVRVLTVDPGEMNTRMHSDAMPDADPATLEDPQRVADALVRLIRCASAWSSGARLEVQRTMKEVA